MNRVFGLKNCDTCKKAVKSLQADGVAHDFIDIRTEADLAEDTRFMVVVSDSEDEQSVYKNGGGVKAIADLYMARHTLETSMLALCRVGAYR